MSGSGLPQREHAQNDGQPRQTNEAEQVSMEGFLESCRATLEDDEELPDADEEENEEDCYDSEDNYDEECLSSNEVRVTSLARGSTGTMIMLSKGNYLL